MSNLLLEDYIAPQEEFLPDGKLRIHQHVDYDKSNWPVGRNLFIDFTTAEPESNDIPQWTNMKPNNNSVIPLMTGTEYLTVSSDKLSEWATDSNGWNLDCEFAVYELFWRLGVGKKNRGRVIVTSTKSVRNST